MIPRRQPGDFFLAPISGRVGAGIRFGQFLNGEGFIEYQHAGILLNSGWTIEAMPGGAILGKISNYPYESLRWSTGLVELTPAQRVAIVRAGWHARGIPYSFLDYLALAGHRFHMPLPRLRQYIADSGHMICSQLVDHLYARGGKHLFDDGRWPGYVTPASLNMLLNDIENYNLSQGR